VTAVMGRERLKYYSLTGEQGERAVSDGLAGGSDWFRSDIERKRMKELMRRCDFPAVRDTLLWFGLLVAFAAAGVVLWRSWPAFVCFAIYGVLYGTASDSRWHECGHGTAFKNPWLNDRVYAIASFMDMRDPTVWRWSHTRHHTDTLIVGRDREIAVMRPARLARLTANLFGLLEFPHNLREMVVHASGHLTPDERTFVPPEEEKKVFRTARVWCVIYALMIAACAVTRSVVPFLLIGGPRIYGVWLLEIYALTQHAGLGENVLDHRLNTRTLYMGRVNRFIYWNMNYHIEHHMFPMVPYHRLADLHEQVKHDMPEAYPSMWAAYKEIIPAVLRQLKDQTYYVRRELPPGAAPYRVPPDGRAVLEG
jgi:fatty acid desaturase